MACNDNIVEKKVFYLEGIYLLPEVTANHREKAYALLKADADKILKLIEVQIENLMTPQCPLYEEVLDTQMFGLSREIDFAVRLNLIGENEGKALLENLERQLNILHEAAQKSV
ncbi:YlaN family protein [Lentibacillus sp. Marseille-P4043]|uniref:YlaN family protein n=1 Tax=Lentibacillus sp. Marseille-P4043 TaxID=2040293 RepID=UPI000D0AFB7F|nr:YlaN family protein [Lentibacillus sp. Marseille-P4043]